MRACLSVFQLLLALECRDNRHLPREPLQQQIDCGSASGKLLLACAWHHPSQVVLTAYHSCRAKVATEHGTGTNTLHILPGHPRQHHRTGSRRPGGLGQLPTTGLSHHCMGRRQVCTQRMAAFLAISAVSRQVCGGHCACSAGQLSQPSLQWCSVSSRGSPRQGGTHMAEAPSERCG